MADTPKPLGPAKPKGLNPIDELSRNYDRFFGKSDPPMSSMERRGYVKSAPAAPAKATSTPAAAPPQKPRTKAGTSAALAPKPAAPTRKAGTSAALSRPTPAAAPKPAVRPAPKPAAPKSMADRLGLTQNDKDVMAGKRTGKAAPVAASKAKSTSGLSANKSYSDYKKFMGD